MRKENYNLTKYACFSMSATTAVSTSLSPLLFTTFHSVYGLSFTLLGLLVVLNFATQLLFDLIYSFFSNKINLKVSVKLTPFFMAVGLFAYALLPYVFPNNVFIGLAIGTVIISTGSGLAEVLTSPVVAAIPSDNSEKLLSATHSCYAWGLVLIVIFCAMYIYLFGTATWQVLALILTVLPIATFILMLFSPIPELKAQENVASEKGVLRNKTAVLYIISIFFGGATEISMNQWCSGYLETAFGIDKTVCDLLGLALFGFSLGLGRTLYAKFGKNIDKVLLISSVGSTACYLTATLTNVPVLGLIACALTGFTAAMLWPGSLIAVNNRIKDGGVNLYALMAVGGDLGGTVYPQVIGIVIDLVIASPVLVNFGSKIGLSAEQIGMKAGMAFGTLAPLISTILFLIPFISERKKKKASSL